MHPRRDAPFFENGVIYVGHTRMLELRPKTKNQWGLCRFNPKNIG